MSFPLRAIAVVIALALLAAASAPARAADPVFLPGSRIGLIPPAGMVPSRNVRGFEDRERQAVIIVSELAAQTHSKIEEEFTLDALKAQGFEIIARDTIALNEGRGLLVAVRQPATRVRQWALIVLAGDLTAVVIALMPEAAGDTYPDAAMRAALASFVTRGKLPPEELLAVLPYAIRDLAGFHVVRTSPDGTAELTFGPEDTPLPAQQPYFAIALRPGEMPAADQQQSFARSALAPFIGGGEAKLVRSEPQRIGGRPGYEIIVETRDTKANVDLMVVQWLRFGTSGYMQILGMARKDVWEEAFPRMRALRDAIEPK